MITNMKSAIFDMDGTLVDSLMLWDMFWTEFGMRYRGDPSFRPSSEVDRAVRTMTLSDAMELVHKTYGMGGSGDELMTIANDRMIRFYGEEVQLKAGVREFLDSCLAQGVKMCIASATDVGLIRIAMAHCGLERYFPRIFSCAEFGKGKDCPDIYLAAQSYLGTEACDTWVFEDSCVALCTARKLGMHTVGIFDRFNYGQDVLQQNADFYIPEGGSLAGLMK